MERDGSNKGKGFLLSCSFILVHVKAFRPAKETYKEGEDRLDE